MLCRGAPGEEAPPARMIVSADAPLAMRLPLVRKRITLSYIFFFLTCTPKAQPLASSRAMLAEPTAGARPARRIRVEAVPLSMRSSRRSLRCVPSARCRSCELASSPCVCTVPRPHPIPSSAHRNSPRHRSCCTSCAQHVVVHRRELRHASATSVRLCSIHVSPSTVVAR